MLKYLLALLRSFVDVRLRDVFLELGGFNLKHHDLAIDPIFRAHFVSVFMTLLLIAPGSATPALAKRTMRSLFPIGVRF